MTGIRPTGQAGAAAPGDARLETVARQLEGVFVQQLFKAMRETVPHDGAFDGGSGEDLFTSMMDETLADQLPGQWHHGIGERLIRQLRDAVSQSGPRSPSETT